MTMSLIFEAMITAAVANALPNLTAALRTQITNDIRSAGASGGGGGGNAIPQGIHVWIKRFTKLKSLAFWSAATPAEAEDWITHMEKLFQVLGCPNNFKTRLAAFKLEGDALRCGKRYLRTQLEAIILPILGSLDKKWMSFFGWEHTAGDAQRQARHFKWGLKKWVLDRIVNTEYTNVAQVAAAAQVYWFGMGMDRQCQSNLNQTARVFVIRLLGDVLLVGFQLKREIVPKRSRIRVAGIFADFIPYRTGLCSTRDQAAKTSGTITGTLYIDDRTVFVLFDTGATHSIISTTFAKKLNVTPTP
ncbi:zinc finger, CCHC-type, retrotransposon gag domain protein [Tanacetum coccineum]